MSGWMFVVMGLMGLVILVIGADLMGESLKAGRFSEVIFRFISSVIGINFGLLLIFCSNYYWIKKFHIYLPSATWWSGYDGGILPDEGGRVVLILVSLLQLGVFVSHRLFLRFGKGGK